MNVTAKKPDPVAQAPPVNAAPRKAVPAGNSLPPAGNTAPPVRHREPPVSVEKAVEQIQAYLRDSRRQLDIQLDEGSGRMVIRVINPTSGEVIRQIPSEEVLKLAASMDAQGFHIVSELA